MTTVRKSDLKFRRSKINGIENFKNTRKKILVLDDEMGEEIANGIRLFDGIRNEDVIFANTAEDAMEILESPSNRVGIILLDIQLPKDKKYAPSGNGLELIGRLVANDGEVVIVVFTGHATDKNYQHTAEQRGVFRFVAKGKSYNHLEPIIREAMFLRETCISCQQIESKNRKIQIQALPPGDRESHLRQLINEIGVPLKPSKVRLFLISELNNFLAIDGTAIEIDQLSSLPETFIEDLHRTPRATCGDPNSTNPPTWLQESEFPVKNGWLNLPLIFADSVVGLASLHFKELDEQPRVVIERIRRFLDAITSRVLWCHMQKLMEAEVNKVKRIARKGFFPGGDPWSGIAGSSSVLTEIKTKIKKVAATNYSVYLHGETGTGKENCADAIHKLSDRSENPFVKINCANLSDNGSDLFGHCKGAFTGAIANHVGFFEEANGGTVFLDEVGELTPKLQKSLLEVTDMDKRTFRRLGETKVRRTDVRIVCATLRDLKAMVDEGTFREDLYARLAQVTITCPPIRERDRDTIEIAEMLIEQEVSARNLKRIEYNPEDLEILLEYKWKRNVRQLRETIRSWLLWVDEDQPIKRQFMRENITSELLESDASAEEVNKGDREILSLRDAYFATEEESIREPIKCEIERLMNAAFFEGGSIRAACRILGVSAGTWYNYLREFELHIGESKS